MNDEELERRALELWPPHYAHRWLRAIEFLRTTKRGWTLDMPQQGPKLTLVKPPSERS